MQNADRPAKARHALRALSPCDPWWRRSLYVLAALLVLLAGAVGVAAVRLRRRVLHARGQHLDANHHARELAFDGPVTLQLWPQPAVTVQRVRLSERGQPQQVFAGIEHAALSLRLRPLLFEREIEVESVSARRVTLRFQRDADGRRNIDDLLDRCGQGRAELPASR